MLRDLLLDPHHFGRAKATTLSPRSTACRSSQPATLASDCLAVADTVGGVTRSGRLWPRRLVTEARHCASGRSPRPGRIPSLVPAQLLTPP